MLITDAAPITGVAVRAHTVRFYELMVLVALVGTSS